MFLLQKGECKICNTTSTKPLSVDHCHSTGKIRGLLCNPCNMGIGQFKDSIVRLKNAISYLEGSDDQIKS